MARFYSGVRGGNPGSVFSGTVNFPIHSFPGRVLMTSSHTTIDSNPIVLAQDTSNLSLTSFSWRLSTTGPARSFNWLSIGIIMNKYKWS
jgi:hypothetical protein